MRLLWFELRDFRNHPSTRLLDLPSGVIVVAGANGEGKTNLLEGMFYLFSLASPRVSSSLPLVREGAESGYVRGEVETLAGRVMAEVEIPVTGASKVKVNRSPIRRKRDLRRQIRAVFFGPEDLDVVRGDPSGRRRFMDEAATALWPLKESVLTAYDRALRQRNRLLKDWQGAGVPPGLDAWDAELIQTGSALTRLRADAIAALAPGAEDEFRYVSGYGLRCAYVPSVRGEPIEEAFRSRLSDRLRDELIRRTSLVGPHRDELELAVRDLGARSFASHGEAWAAALCLRLGLAVAVHQEVGESPVMLLDDPFSALDPQRQARVAARLLGRGQVVVSVADESHVPESAAAVWDVTEGAVAVRGAA